MVLTVIIISAVVSILLVAAVLFYIVFNKMFSEMNIPNKGVNKIGKIKDIKAKKISYTEVGYIFKIDDNSIALVLYGHQNTNHKWNYYVIMNKYIRYIVPYKISFSFNKLMNFNNTMNIRS